MSSRSPELAEGSAPLRIVRSTRLLTYRETNLQWDGVAHLSDAFQLRVFNRAFFIGVFPDSAYIPDNDTYF